MTASRDAAGTSCHYERGPSEAVRGHLRPVGLENHQNDHLGPTPTSHDAPEEQVG